MSLILPRFYARQQEVVRLQKIARIVAESAAVEAPQTVAMATLAGDARRMRGVPITARGVGGTSPGTDPAVEVCRRNVRHAI